MGHQFITSNRDPFPENKMAVGAMKTPAVFQALESLSHELDLLQDAAKGMYDRLQPVLRQELQETEKSESERASTNCQLADQLLSRASKARQVRQVLQMAMLELEI